MNNERLIEVDFPLREISEASVREKNIRHGYISTLHVWWARSGPGGLKPSTLEQKVKETLSQIGAEILEDSRE